jgi:hypothetical protein
VKRQRPRKMVPRLPVEGNKKPPTGKARLRAHTLAVEMRRTPRLGEKGRGRSYRTIAEKLGYTEEQARELVRGRPRPVVR